jgi:hypothetical protein
MMKFKCVSPFDIDFDGRTVKIGEVIDVSAQVAGHAPDPTLVPLMHELHQAITDRLHPLVSELRQRIGALDMGDGLLAQPDNWQPVVAQAKKDEVPA